MAQLRLQAEGLLGLLSTHVVQHIPHSFSRLGSVLPNARESMMQLTIQVVSAVRSATGMDAWMKLVHPLVPTLVGIIGDGFANAASLAALKITAVIDGDDI